VIGNLDGGLKSLTLFVCAGVMGTLWKTRNDVIFNGKVLASLKKIIHKINLLVKSLKPKAHAIAETIILEKLQQGLTEA
jgi:hypothetical protein